MLVYGYEGVDLGRVWITRWRQHKRGGVTKPGSAVCLDSGADPVRSFDITADGRLVGVIDSVGTNLGAAAPPHIDVVLNWFEELKRLVPVKWPDAATAGESPFLPSPV